MSLLVQAAPREHFGWLTSRAQLAITPEFEAIEAVDSQGRIRGMVGCDGWWGNAVQMHIALDSPAALRALLRPAFDYVFRQAKKDAALAIVPAHNARSQALVRHAGFREAYRVRDGWAPGDDVVVFEMRRGECPWLREKVGNG